MSAAGEDLWPFEQFRARTRTEWDAVTLERGAEVLRRRSSKPRSRWLAVYCKILTDTAAKIRTEAGDEP